MDIKDAWDALDDCDGSHSAKSVDEAQFMVSHKVRSVVFKLIDMAIDESLSLAELAYIQSHLEGVIHQNRRLIERKARQWTEIE